MNKKKFIDDWHDLCSNNGGKATILMSGIGTNAIKLLESQTRFQGMEILGIFSDNINSNASTIAKKYSLEDFTKVWGANETRNEYFKEVMEILQQEGVNILLYAGFMKIVPHFFASGFLSINSHPADLTILDERGAPRYVGMSAIKDTINDGKKEICCSCCIVDCPVDTGYVLGKSRKISINEDDSVSILHAKLKKEEHIYYADIVESLCKGQI